MHNTRFHRSLLSLLGCCLIVLLAACSSGSPPATGPGTPGSTPTGGSGTVAPGHTPGVTPPTGGGITPVATTVPVPPTQTSCPAAGAARAAVTAPLALGNHPNIVYIVTQFTGSNSTSTLKRYDVSTGNKTEIIKLTNTSIFEAQVSADGQWILFVALANASSQRMLQMIRMDGQGLQTLYCGSNVTNVQWSTNQQLVAFNTAIGNNAGTYLLNMISGNLQLELKASTGPPLNTQNSAIPLTWLDNTRLYVTFSAEPIAPINMIGLLDTSKGPNQQFSDLTTVFQQQVSSTFNYPCFDADSSYDSSTLFVSQCSGISAPNCSGSCALGTREGPSSISTQAPTSSTRHTIFTDATLGIASVRAVSSQTLLLAVENFSENHTVDTSHNGLWRVSTTGTGLSRLTTVSPGVQLTLNTFTQDPWSNVSRDGSMYVYATSASATGSSGPTYSLFFGSLSGGSPTTFASISDGTRLEIAGWTIM